MTKFRIHLDPEEEKLLTDLLTKGSHPAQTLTRARILLLRNQGKGYDDIEKSLHISNKMVYAVLKRYSTCGLERAIYDKKRPGHKKWITPEMEAKVTALTCESPPPGHDHWTSPLMKEILPQRFNFTLSEMSIKRIWKTHKLKPWKKKCGASQKLRPSSSKK